mgnify:CR=1 FL=1
MYDKSPSLAELLAKEGLSCEKIVTGRIGYIRVENLFEKMHGGLCLRVKMLWLGLLIIWGSVNFLLVLRLR